MDGIVLAPLDEKALVRPVEEAKRLGIPTVVVDSALASDQIVSFVATDNVEGRRAWAPTRSAALLGGKGAVLLLRYQEGSASTTHARGGLPRPR